MLPAAKGLTEDEEKQEEIEKGSDGADGAQAKNIILLVEDSTDVRKYLRGALEPLYTVVKRPTARQALKQPGRSYRT